MIGEHFDFPEKFYENPNFFREFDTIWSGKSAFSSNFLQNNNIFIQESHYFNKYQPREKFIFWQLVGIFIHFWQNNSIFMQERAHI